MSKQKMSDDLLPVFMAYQSGNRRAHGLRWQRFSSKREELCTLKLKSLGFAPKTHP
jgi:hypothetical protein